LTENNGIIVIPERAYRFYDIPFCHVPFIGGGLMEKEKKPYEKPVLKKHEDLKIIKGQNRPPVGSPSF
jgi:hypothetical protein